MGVNMQGSACGLNKCMHVLVCVCMGVYMVFLFPCTGQNEASTAQIWETLDSAGPL